MDGQVMFQGVGTTYDLAHENDVFSSYEEHASCDICVAVADEHSFHCVLQHKVGCSRGVYDAKEW